MASSARRQTRFVSQYGLPHEHDFDLFDIVLPAATFYEKNDINTTDMHSFIHPFVKAVQCSWEGRSDWQTFKDIAKKLSEIAGEYPEDFGNVTDMVLTPLGHDSPHELGQALDVKNWYKGNAI